ncbi:DUF1289 domain-containing protein [Oceanospirillum maris]|uniref:DUF1289 domain-containing protein n=1 Tax=Oceanospirillum maris TaxID=64977 RepID=UPI000409E5B1|nr:DUF1289 domain-containing protein [Oceanospirillum maris]
MSQKEFEPQSTKPEVFDPKQAGTDKCAATMVLSPCSNICALNDEGFCIGCYRDGNEIRLWSTYSNEQKRQVLNSCQRRASLDQAFI